jgi:predicted Zn-dependent protease
MVDAQEMIPLAGEIYSELLTGAEQSSDKALVNKVITIGTDLKEGTIARLEGDKKAAFILDFTWEFTVFESRQATVWALPGGYFGITTGMLSLCSNDDEIAAVLAHALGHLIGNHTGERLHLGLRETISSALYSRAARDHEATTKQLMISSAGIGSARSILPYTINQEKEADEIGLFLMAHAGYNPRAFLDFWVRYEENKDAESEDWGRIHEGPSGRLVFLSNNLPQALVIYKDSPFSIKQ